MMMTSAPRSARSDDATTASGVVVASTTRRPANGPACAVIVAGGGPPGGGGACSQLHLHDGIHDVTDVVTRQPVVSRKAQRAVHHAIALGEAAVGLTVIDVSEPGLTQDVSCPHHAGRQVLLDEVLLHGGAIDALGQHEGVAHPC